METGVPERRVTASGIPISSSQVARLEREVKSDKEAYDSLQIKKLTSTGMDSDPAKKKNEEGKLENLRKLIR